MAMLLFFFGWSALFAVDSPIPYPRSSFPVADREDLLLGKLWLDIGLFYPFTGVVDRTQWERQYFKSLSDFTDGKISYEQALSNVVGALGDPESFVAKRPEEKCDYFIPCLFEIRHDGIWIVAGPKAIFKASFGPLKSIKGVPIQSISSAYYGSEVNSEQQLSSLYYFCRSSKSISISLSSIGGQTVSIDTTLAAPEDCFIDGGWHGVPIHSFFTSLNTDSSKSTLLDLRSSPWLSTDKEMMKSINSKIRLLRTKYLTRNVFSIQRVNTGYAEDRRFKAYESGAQEVPYSQGGDPELPPLTCYGNPSGLPLEYQAALSGWILTDKNNLALKETILQMGSSNIHLRIKSLGIGTLSLKSSEPNPYWINWSSLNSKAAKLIAVASILNVDQYFAFTSKAKQESLYNNISNLDLSLSLKEILCRVAGLTQDAHAWFTWSCPIEGAESDSDVNSYSLFYPASFIYDAPQKSLIVMRPTGKNGLNQSDVVTSIENKGIPYWVSIAQKYMPGNKENPRSLDLGLCLALSNYCESNSKSALNFELRRSGVLQTLGIQRKAEPFTNAELAMIVGQPPHGWTYFGNGSHITLNEAVNLLKHGSNIILDFRRGISFFDINELEENPDICRFTDMAIQRSPDSPFEWGKAGFDLGGKIWQREVGNKDHLEGSGMAIILVDRGNQSAGETFPALLRSAFGNSAAIVGTQSMGTTGPLAYFRFPVGGSKKFVPWYRTLSWPKFEYFTQGSGLKLDYEIPLDQVEANLRHNTEKDPLLSIIYNNIHKIENQINETRKNVVTKDE